jgi:hypothetical protein
MQSSFDLLRLMRCMCMIELAQKAWKSKAYDHYTVTLVHHFTKEGEHHYLAFKFTCKHDLVNHPPQFRHCMKTSQGTKNLDCSTATCECQRGVTGDSSSGAQQTLTKSVSKYSPSRHRAIIAMCCAVSHHPFNSVADPLYHVSTRHGFSHGSIIHGYGYGYGFTHRLPTDIY